MRRIALIIAAVVAASSGAFAIGDWVVSSFEVPSECEFPLGIAYDGTNIYVSDGLDDQIFVLTDDGTEVDSFTVGSGGQYFTGLTHDSDSDNLWAVGLTSKSLFEIDKNNGNIISSFAVHTNNPNMYSAVYSDSDNNLYVSNNSSAHSYIYEYNTGGSLQTSFLSFAKYPAGLDIIENSGTNYIFNLGGADGYFVLHELNGTPHPEFTYATSSPVGDYNGDFAFKEEMFDNDGHAHMWHLDPFTGDVYYLQVEWDSPGIKSASLGEIKALFR